MVPAAGVSRYAAPRPRASVWGGRGGGGERRQAGCKGLHFLPAHSALPSASPRPPVAKLKLGPLSGASATISMGKSADHALPSAPFPRTLSCPLRVPWPLSWAPESCPPWPSSRTSCCGPRDRRPPARWAPVLSRSAPPLVCCSLRYLVGTHFLNLTLAGLPHRTEGPPAPPELDTQVVILFFSSPRNTLQNSHHHKTSRTLMAWGGGGVI